MDLKLPIDLAIGYKSKSQIARVITEAWVLLKIRCPNCSDKLCEYPANEKSKDVFCSSCNEDFQIKNSKKSFQRELLVPNIIQL